jgi:hypothetical protein
METPEMISLSQAALRIGKGWSVTNRLMLSGKLGLAHQNPDGRWYVSADGVADYLEQLKSQAAMVVTPRT